MSVEVTDNRSESRYEVREDGELAGFADYDRREGVLAFTHTETFPEFGGRGLAGRLVEAALDDVRARGLGVLPFCSYVRKVVGEQPERFADLVPEQERERFGLG